jgi:hypothetical protein
VVPACADGGATDAVAMRERVAAWVAGKPQPPSLLLPLGMPREFDVVVSSKKQRQGG